MPKSQTNLKVHNYFNNLGRDSAYEYEYTWILGSEPGVDIQWRCRLKLLLPYGPILTKTKRNWKYLNLKFGEKAGLEIWW